MKIVRLDGQVLWNENDDNKKEVKEEEKFDGRPEINRRALMKILCQKLDQQRLALGKKLQEALLSTTEHKYALHLVNGTIECAFDLLIGGDGAWSRVRKFLTDEKPRYSGISRDTGSLYDIHRSTLEKGP